MTRIFLLAACLSVTALSSAAEELPRGLQSARLLPGWTDAQGNRIAALELTLEPGWKTYWRNPGDSGLPPSFDWQGSGNLSEIELHWPAPEAIRSGDELTLGYHDRLVLPFTARPVDVSKPVTLLSAVDFGVCEQICVPAHVTLQAPQPAAEPDPLIEAALARVPQMRATQPACTMQDIADGVRLSVLLPQSDAEVAAMEVIGQPDIWVSSADIEPDADAPGATADFVPPSGKPFDLDTGDVRITLIGADGAVEMQGCDSSQD